MKKIFLTIFPILLFLSGCVYFNTFYMARRNFKIAERQYEKDKGVVSQTNKKNYTDSIEAAALVVRDFPDSKYIDDSLFIIGISYFRTGDYSRALLKFNEILQAFPDGEFAAERPFAHHPPRRAHHPFGTAVCVCNGRSPISRQLA